MSIDASTQASQARTESAYVNLLEQTNAQLSMRWSPYGVLLAGIGVSVAVLGVLFAAGAIVAGVMVFSQSRDFRARLDDASAKLDASVRRTTELEEQLGAKLKESSALIDQIHDQRTEALARLHAAPDEVKAEILSKIEGLVDLTNIIASSSGLRGSSPGIRQKTVQLAGGYIRSKRPNAIEYQFVGSGFEMTGEIGDFYHMNVMHPGPAGPPISLAINARGFSTGIANASVDGVSFPKVTCRGQILATGSAPAPEPNQAAVSGPFGLAGRIWGYVVPGLGGYPDEHPPVFEVAFLASGTATAEVSQQEAPDRRTVVVTRLEYTIG